MSSSRLERAARALLDVLSIRSVAVHEAADELRAALAEAEAGRAGTGADPRCARCGKPVTLMQSQLPDEVGLPCHKNCPLPATAAEARAAALEEAAEALRLLRPNSEGYRRSEWDRFDFEMPCADAIDKAFDIGAAAIRALILTKPATAADVRAAALEEAEREVVCAAVDFATMAAPDAEEWGSIRVVRLGRLVNAVHALRGIRASGPA